MSNEAARSARKPGSTEWQDGTGWKRPSDHEEDRKDPKTKTPTPFLCSFLCSLDWANACASVTQNRRLANRAMAARTAVFLMWTMLDRDSVCEDSV